MATVPAAAHAATQATAAATTQRAPVATRWDMPYPEVPRYLQIETVVTCNAECPFCPQHDIARQPVRMYDWVWKKIIDDTRGLGIVYRPFLQNEPFVDKRVPEIMRHIRKDLTAKIEFNTNGSLLTEKLSREILDIGIDIMRFSIDGFSREVYAPSRVGLDYDQVVKRTTEFLKIWRAGGYGRTCYTEVRMIDMPENRHEHQAYKDFWAPLCDQVVITDLYTWPWQGQKQPVAKPCLKMMDGMYFFSDGRATLCCWDTKERGVVGDVTTHGVMEIWGSAQYDAVRTLLNDGRRELIHLCSRCDAYEKHDFSQYEVNPPRVRADEVVAVESIRQAVAGSARTSP
jgi:pyruvate-formate lyase-activating enzyme